VNSADIRDQVSCSLVINVARGDAPILEFTLPHMLDTHKARFREVVVVVDEIPSVGRIGRQSQQYGLDSLYEALEKVRSRGYSFRQEVVSYRSDDVRSIYSKWFGRTDVSYRCASGTPVYAFLYGVEMAHANFRLHLDSDMLIYDPGPTSWVLRAIRVLQEIPEILFVNQTWGMQSEASPAPQYLPSVDLGYGERVSRIFSSRCFLCDMEKLEQALMPITPTKHPFVKRIAYLMQGRPPFVALEQMISAALVHSGTYRADLGMKWGYNLHAWDKRVFADARVSAVINRFAKGYMPAGHIGKHDLDYGLFLDETQELVQHCGE
jgi:hypothetical protein